MNPPKSGTFTLKDGPDDGNKVFGSSWKPITTVKGFPNLIIEDDSDIWQTAIYEWDGECFRFNGQYHEEPAIRVDP